MPGIGSRAVPKTIRLHFNKTAKKRDEDREMRATYAVVDLRDGTRTCRCCGRRCALGGGCSHDHMQPRSTAKRAIKHTRKNVVHVCNDCNQLLKLKKIATVGTNADGPLAYKWTALATPIERRFGNAKQTHEHRLRDERGAVRRRTGHMNDTINETTRDIMDPVADPNGPQVPVNTQPQTTSDQGDGGGNEPAEDRSVANDDGPTDDEGGDVSGR